MTTIFTLAMAFFGGCFVGAFILDRRSRYKHGHSYSEQIRRDFDLQWDILRHTALAHLQTPFSEHVRSLSPDADKLFAEAQAAEKGHLAEIAGLGYAKALEMLIKDVAKATHPDKAEAIESATLASCVRSYLTDDLIRNSSELAVWLRNDQVHYKRKFDDYGTKELKALIVLVAQLLDESHRRTKFALDVDSLRQAMTRRPPTAAG